jgi:hypothetical protein
VAAAVRIRAWALLVCPGARLIRQKGGYAARRRVMDDARACKATADAASITHRSTKPVATSIQAVSPVFTGVDMVAVLGQRVK